MDFSLRRLGLTRNSKILSITHAHCMDGSTCQICLENVFSRLNCISAKYNEVDSLLERLIHSNFDDHDFVFLTDISPLNKDLLVGQNKIILLDHHNTAKVHHNPHENKYVLDNYCGSYVTKIFLEKFFDKKIPSLDNLVYLVNDYDLWKKQNAKSTFLNELHYMYFPDKFKKRFYDGNTRLTRTELDFIRKKKIEFKSEYDNLELYEMTKTKSCYFEADHFMNELCEKLMKEKYDFVFCRSRNKNSVSVRNKLPYVDVGEVLKELGYGGGHHDAAGFFEPDFFKMKEKMNRIEERIMIDIKRNSK